MKYRYTTFDSILNFYNKNKNVGYPGLCLQEGYKQVPPNYHRKWDLDKISKLEKLGYTHNIAATECTGGDNDYLVIDHVNKEYCFWENGFYPFIGNYRAFPQDEDLAYWASNRR
jgi:hypothetical protein